MKYTFSYYEGEQITSSYVGKFEGNPIHDDLYACRNLDGRDLRAGMYSGFFSTRSHPNMDIGIYSHAAEDAKRNLQAFLDSHCEQ